jgi:hypothetical protein
VWKNSRILNKGVKMKVHNKGAKMKVHNKGAKMKVHEDLPGRTNHTIASSGTL